MADHVTVELFSDLPRAELDRLLRRASAALPNDDESEHLRVQPAEAGTDRSLDPVVVSTLITAGVSLLAPFVAKLAELLFRSEPKATITLAPVPSGQTGVLVSSLAPELRDALLEQALQSGAVRVTIDLPEGKD